LLNAASHRDTAPWNRDAAADAENSASHFATQEKREGKKTIQNAQASAPPSDEETNV